MGALREIQLIKILLPQRHEDTKKCNVKKIEWPDKMQMLFVLLKWPLLSVFVPLWHN